MVRQGLSRALLAAAVGALVALGAACSDDSSSDESSADKAQSAVCSDASELESAVNKLVDDVTSGNFGDASDQVPNVESAFKALESSAKKLASDRKSDVQSELESVKDTLGDLTSAGSLDDIESTLQKAESELKDVVSTIEDTISC